MNENRNDDFLLIYKKNSMMSFYLSQLLGVEGSYIRKGIVNRDIVISTLGDFNILYGMDCNFEKITKLLMTEIGIEKILEDQGDEPEPLHDKELMDGVQPDLNVM